MPEHNRWKRQRAAARPVLHGPVCGSLSSLRLPYIKILLKKIEIFIINAIINILFRKEFCIFMQYTRESAIERLLSKYRAYYNITMFEEDRKPLTAICEFFECTEKYVLSRKASLWSARCEEFLYVFETEHLTKAEFAACRDFACADGLKRADIGPGHMYTYITPVFICDTCEEDARAALKKCRIYKSFHFSLHGWMDFHTAVLEVGNNRITTNRSGKYVEEVMKKILFPKKKKRRRFL